MAEPPRDAGSVATRTLVVVSTALAVELVLLAAAIQAIAGPAIVLAVHFGISGAMLFALRRQVQNGDPDGSALLGVLATLVTGPIGAAGALSLPYLARRNAGAETRLAAWYNRIALSAEQDDLTQLSDRVAIGRAANLAAPAPDAFADLFHTGSLAGQQVALGVIARGFHPAYLPVLKIALESPAPVIRVQAAAVAARVRTKLQERVTDLFARAADPTLTAADAVDIAGDLGAALASGLLEQDQQMRGIGIHQALLSRTFARLDARARDGEVDLPRPIERGSSGATDAYAAHLLAEGRFADYRALRSAFRRPVHGRYRHRLVHARPAGPHLRRALIASHR